MRKITLQIVLVLFVSLLFVSCEDENVTSSESTSAEIFEIHLQTWFENNPVQVKFDNEIIFDDTISTGSILAYASIISLDVTQGEHNIQVIVNDSIQGDTTLTIGDSLYVAVNYNSDQKEIGFYTQNEPFAYK